MNLREVSQLLYLIKLTDQKIGTQFENQVGFSLTRYELLMALTDFQPCLQTQLQEALQIDQAAVTRHLKILEQKGYVDRQRNPKNNREIFVQLTDQAKLELAACEEKHTNVQETVYPFFSQEEFDQLSYLLTKLNQSIERK